MRSIIFILSGLIFSSLFSKAQGGYNIKIKINNYQEQQLYLGFNYGDKRYIKDTAYVDKKGYFNFKGNEKLLPGIYLGITANKKYFEFLVDEQSFTLETDTVDFIGKMKVTGSPNNDLFFQYLNFLNPHQQTLMKLSEKRKSFEQNSDSVAAINNRIKSLDDKIKDYRLAIVDKSPQSYLALIINTMKEPEFPEAPIDEYGVVDSLYPFRYFKANYLKNVDLGDERLARTPLLHNKVKYYLDKLTVQIPDSIISAFDMIAQRAKPAPENFKYIVHTFANYYEKSNIMGMEAVFVHIALNYYNEREAFWADTATINRIQERAIALKPLLIGRPAPNIILPDTSENKWYDLSKVRADYTILYFWDPNCGHCKKVTPQLDEIYKSYKSKGVEVFAVSTPLENKDWKKFISEKKLSFINVSDSPEINKNPIKYLDKTDINSLNFRKVYDIKSTPVVYVLDKDKKIIARRLGVEDLNDYLSKIIP
jgi:thiol-disulfide isomerase/thioredoxin